MTSPKGRKQRLYYCLFHTSNHFNPFTQILFRDYPILNSHNQRFSQCFLSHNVVLSKLKSSFENWYPEQIVAQIKKNGFDEVPIELVHHNCRSPSRVVACYPHHTPLQWAE